jgi:hypothetical protein
MELSEPCVCSTGRPLMVNLVMAEQSAGTYPHPRRDRYTVPEDRGTLVVLTELPSDFIRATTSLLHGR